MQSRSRKELGESEGERCLYTGEFVRTGFKDGFKGPVKTVLLKDVKDETDRIITDGSVAKNLVILQNK